MRRVLAAGLVVALAAPAFGLTPDQELTRAWALFRYPSYDYRRANAAAQAYLRAYGPRFSAAFLAAASQCMMAPHNPNNIAAFRQLRRDYAIGGAQAITVADWMTSNCAGPRQAGVGGQALTSTPSTAAAEPSNHEPPPLHPRPAPAPPPPPPPPAVSAPMTRPLSADRCRDPFVWRVAFPGDHVCVPMQVRLDAADDNAHAAERRNPAGPYGPMTCIQGYVWRDARDGDTVCVTPDRRDAAHAANAAAASRRLQP